MQFIYDRPAGFMFAVCLFMTFAVTVLILRRLIPFLKSMHMGQKILDIGPRWHKSKEGTPTMGGLAFIVSMTLVLAAALLTIMLYGGDGALGKVCSDVLGSPVKLIITFSMALLSGVIGMIDDSAKLRKKQNEGLTASQKFLLQLILAACYLFLMRATGNLSTEMYIPYLGVRVQLGIFYYIFALILITGFLNSVNLNDGIDGLCSSMSAAVGIFFAYASFKAGAFDCMLLSAVCIGGCLGFLVYNFHPARVFMGDTGSLFLGGLLVGMAFMLDNPLIIVVCGLVYICETLSVMIQVTYFKLTHGKRFFKMAPIHHHFEKCGWSEVKIVIIFTLATCVCCAAAVYGL